MPRRELSRTATVTREMRELGALIYPLVAGPRQPRGWPDRLVAWADELWLIEMKDEDYRLSPDQESMHTLLLRLAPDRIWCCRFLGDEMVMSKHGADRVWVLEASGRSLLLFLRRVRDGKT